MMIAIRRLALLLGPALLGSVLLGACGAGTEPPRAEETSVRPSPPSSSGAGETPTGVVAVSVADLSATLGVESDEVEVVSVEEVTWRDGSRGCAKPGEMYTQALVDGSRITLRAEGRTYEYHAGGSQPPSRCDKPTQ